MTLKNNPGLLTFILGTTAFVPLSVALADSPPAKLDAAQKPNWLTEVSLGIKESYDDNVYLSGVDTKNLPAYSVPSGSVAALKNQSSWVTTVSPKIGVDLAPLLGNENLQTLSFAYVPDFVVYHDEPSESFNAHRFVTTLRAKTKSVSINLDNTFTFIDGNDYGPTYPNGYCSAYVNSAVRERREQFQDRAKISIRFDTENWFIRPTASLAYYDLLTEHINTTGYQNYADRYDVNGGVDVGYKIWKQFALTLGYRYGHQYQQSLDFSPYSSPSDYQRVLFGFEGKPLKWLKIEVQMGPDFRSYAQSDATHTTPVTDKNLTTYYGEASIVADVTKNDSFTFKYKQFQWVSSTGKVPYFDSTYDLTYRRKLTDKLTMDLGARMLTSDYNSGNLSTCRRNDIQYTLSAGLTYNFNPHFGVNANYSADLGRNAQGNINNPEYREFNRNVFSLGAVIKF